MSDLEVEFVGICTHILPGPDWPHPHRVVLPRPTSHNHHHHHEGRLIIPEEDVTPEAITAFVEQGGPSLELESHINAYSVLLKGVSLGIENATGGYDWDRRTFPCGIFPLSDFANGQPLGPPDEEVAHGRLAERAHAYFDIPVGMLSARLVLEESSAAVLDVQTEGSPVLKAESFDKRFEARLELRRGARIQLTHSAADTADEHFLLHFELATNKPANPTYPETPPECLAPELGLGPGCSNSTFP